MAIQDDLANAPIWQKIILAVLTIAIVYGGLKNYVIKDKPHQLKQLKKKVKRLEQNIKSQQSFANNYEITRKRYEEIAGNLSSDLPSLKTVNTFISHLISVASELQVNVTKVQPQEVIVEITYWQLPVDLIAQGSLSSLVRFIRNIELSIMKSTMTKLQINRMSEGLYQLEISLLINTSTTEESSISADQLYTPKIRNSQATLKKPTPIKRVKRLTLSGFWTGKKQGAFINGELVDIGDKVMGYQVIAIDSVNGSVLLQKNGKRKMLTLKD